ncbi:SCO4225 family membrane protein, partial [Nonomuraea sp. NPDC004297]
GSEPFRAPGGDVLPPAGPERNVETMRGRALATWVAGGYAAIVILLGIVAWFTSQRGVPDLFTMIQTVITLPLSYVVSRSGLTGIGWILAIDVAGLIQAGALWLVLGGLRH